MDKSGDLDPTDPVKKTVGQALPLNSPRHIYEAKCVQHSLA